MKIILIIFATLSMLIAACDGKSDPTAVPATEVPPTTEAQSSNSDEATEVPSVSEATATEEEIVVVESNRPDWHFAKLTDVNTGETFTLADFEGKTVFVETMATWCSNCRKQLQNVRTARGDLQGDEFVFLALSLETNLKDEDLASYTSREGFNWTFAVMSEDLLRAFADEFGRSVTNAPSTPHFIINPDGTYTELVTGIDSPDKIISEMTAANGA